MYWFVQWVCINNCDSVTYTIPVKFKILRNKNCVHSVNWRIGSDKNFK